jgi:hypothetical protein
MTRNRTLTSVIGRRDKVNLPNLTNSTTGIAFDGTDYYISNIYHQTISVYDGSGNFVHDFTLQNAAFQL